MFCSQATETTHTVCSYEYLATSGSLVMIPKATTSPAAYNHSHLQPLHNLTPSITCSKTHDVPHHGWMASNIPTNNPGT